MNCLSDVLSLVHRAVFILLYATILLPFYILLAFFLPSANTREQTRYTYSTTTTNIQTIYTVKVGPQQSLRLPQKVTTKHSHLTQHVADDRSKDKLVSLSNFSDSNIASSAVQVILIQPKLNTYLLLLLNTQHPILLNQTSNILRAQDIAATST